MPGPGQDYRYEVRRVLLQDDNSPTKKQYEISVITGDEPQGLVITRYGQQNKLSNGGAQLGSCFGAAPAANKIKRAKERKGYHVLSDDTRTIESLDDLDRWISMSRARKCAPGDIAAVAPNSKFAGMKSSKVLKRAGADEDGVTRKHEEDAKMAQAAAMRADSLLKLEREAEAEREAKSLSHLTNYGRF